MSTLAQLSVLVADADPDAGLLYANSLRIPEHHVRQATDGRDALVKALSVPPSFVITETVLPFVDGYSLCEILRREPATKSVPILVVTTDSCTASRDRVLSTGADSVLVKPCDPDLVRFEMLRLIGRSQDLRARAAQLVINATARRIRANAVLERSLEKHRVRKSAAIDRYQTSHPPVAPPQLRCPLCDRGLTYTASYVGGVSVRFSEQWDHFTCSGGCGDFQYRHRTRKLRAV